MQTYTLTYTLEARDPAALRAHLASLQATEPPADVTLLELLGSVGLDLCGVGCEVVRVDAALAWASGPGAGGLARLEPVAKPRGLGAELERVAGSLTSGGGVWRYGGT